jgi:tetratricopeptide (TPR) repeat protein
LAIYAEFARAHVRYALPSLADTPPMHLLERAHAIPLQSTGVARTRPRWCWPAVAAAAAGVTAAFFATWQVLDRRESSLSSDARSAIALQLRQSSHGGLLYAGDLTPEPRGIRGDWPSTAVDLAALSAALDPEKGSPDTAFWLIAALLADEQPREVDVYLRAALARFGDDARFHNLAAIHAYKASRLDEAESQLREALRLTRDPAYLVNLASVLEEEGRVAEAMPLWDEVRRLPDAPSAVVERARQSRTH